MLKIRLQRHGKKNQPIYRIVVARKNWPIKGKYIEALGYYNPLRKPKEVSLNEERVRYWLSSGAKISDTVAKLLFQFGSKKLVSEFKINEIISLLRKKPKKEKKKKEEKLEKLPQPKEEVEEKEVPEKTPEGS